MHGLRTLGIPGFSSNQGFQFLLGTLPITMEAEGDSGAPFPLHPRLQVPGPAPGALGKDHGSVGANLPYKLMLTQGSGH